MNLKRILYLIYVVLVALPIFVVLTILTAVISALGSIAGAERIFGYWPGRIWSKLTLWVLLIPVKVIGREYLPKDRPTVVAPNHTSAMDIFLLYGYAGVRFKWVMKGSLRNIPFVGWACEKIGFIFVDNTPSGAKRVVEDCEKAIENGYHIFMFPEGSRTLTGRLDRLRKGAFKVAMETGVPIVPAKIKGGFEILKRGTWDLHWGRLSLQFFPPIETDKGKTIEELMQEVRSRLE
ncbi:lysophospholipid acyltransferase family protein [Porphyromonas levii]|uniref:lysophospholipid acyltransferase family protein n=1 Tax=Porphyromonas levii TaxID=28114 RepID=UPI00036EA4E6|nr:lysophospholipid acyltransferase family protein [Porphyromonas levii]MBR8703106.1 Bifunctional protein Aas [Porphyromonas levii]MBR8713958.1 Bifunctional protein Aas [Porphyromonas levii]MBR8715962.1 Bifunctional protein Aas [Porphyromonas levii]MBR8728505.1 Bifunctional protein Aas [Porphyromonas levii]MBR8729574.1 Bifunctional protein Aas [Porphyromonas levii]